MEAIDDMALLREFAARKSEAAFAELVSRRVEFVYSAALRQVRDPVEAQEVTQAVFIILAQKAGRISDKTNLAGWLFKTTRFTAMAHRRAAAKRLQREQEAQMQSELQSTVPDATWEQMSPLLDEALTKLGEKDRQAVLLRYFEKRSLSGVGSELGTGEDGARKRVSRALGKLRRFFSKRGVVAMGGAMTANAVHAAPAALAKSVTAVAVATGAACSGSTSALVKGGLKLMTLMKIKTAVLAGTVLILAASTTTVIIKEAHSSAIDDEWFGANGYQKAPANLLIIRPTHFPGDLASWTMDPEPGRRQFGNNISLKQVILTAYGGLLPDNERTLSRIVLPPDLSNWKFDYLVTVPGDSQKRFQAEIRKQLGLVAAVENRQTEVLFLRLPGSPGPGLKISNGGASKIIFHEQAGD